MGVALAAQPLPSTPLTLQTLWTLPLGGLLSAPPAFADARAYIPVGGNRLEAFTLRPPAPAWSLEVTSPSRPAVGEGLVFLTSTDALLAVREADGQVAWRLPLAGAVGAPLVWNNGWLIVVSRTGVVSAYRALDGHLIWEHEAGSPPSAPPALAADRVYLSLEDGRVLALQVEAGRVLWTRRLGGAPAEMLALDDRLYVGSADRFFYCLAAATGAVEWRWRTGGPIVGRPALDERRVYFASLDNVLRALDRRHGAQSWYAALPLRPQSGPVVVGDTVLVPGVVPALYAFGRDRGLEAATAKLPGDLAAPPYVLDDPWGPIVIAITRDIRDGDQLRALGRPIEPAILPVAPLRGFALVRPSARARGAEDETGTDDDGPQDPLDADKPGTAVPEGDNKSRTADRPKP